MAMRIEAYAIISEDGKIADAAGRMPAVANLYNAVDEGRRGLQSQIVAWERLAGSSRHPRYFLSALEAIPCCVST